MDHVVVFDVVAALNGAQEAAVLVDMPLWVACGSDDIRLRANETPSRLICFDLHSKKIRPLDLLKLHSKQIKRSDLLRVQLQDAARLGRS